MFQHKAGNSPGPKNEVSKGMLSIKKMLQVLRDVCDKQMVSKRVQKKIRCSVGGPKIEIDFVLVCINN